MKRLLLAVVAVSCVLCVSALDAADPAPDPYAITADAGPWVICAASFMNEEAPGLAHQLAEQLRTKYQLAAYVFDRGDAERQKDLEEHRKREEMYGVKLPFRHPRYTQTCAVLIGGFQDMDAANAALKKIKTLPAPDLKLSTGQPAFDVEYMKDPTKSGADAAAAVRVNPLARGFVTRNPTAPAPKNDAPKFDPAWKQLNSSESYSLLKNAKPWTLVVKQYVGATSLQDRREPSTGLFDWLTKSGRKPGEGIDAAGFQAHHLAEFLSDKKIGFEAYVLHTRTSSIVTVGGFDGPNDPELQRTKERLERLSFRADPNSPPVQGVKGDPIGLFANPLPMEVPHF
jgi:hypothetical protein